MKSLIPVLLSVIIIPILMISIGMLWRKNPPKSINWVYGYRSRSSMKNNKTWKFAHLYQAKVWRWSGVFNIELAVMVLSIIPTELALSKKFDKDGNLR